MRLAILVIHICAGITGILSGAAAMSFRKGSRWHRVAGNVFFVSMLGMSTAGAYLAFMKHQMNNVFGSVLAFYLVTTAWVAGARRCFRPKARGATSLAHVLFVFHRHRILLPGTATSIPPLVTQNQRTFSSGHPATDIADFLAMSRPVHKCIQEKVGAKLRRCSRLADLDFVAPGERTTMVRSGSSAAADWRS
jgi:uncharacterized membrane protein